MLIAKKGFYYSHLRMFFSGKELYEQRDPVLIKISQSSYQVEDKYMIDEELK